MIISRLSGVVESIQILLLVELRRRLLLLLVGLGVGVALGLRRRGEVVVELSNLLLQQADA